MEFNNLKAALQLIGEDFINKYQDELLSADANASGELFNTLKARVVVDNKHFEVSLDIKEYWKYIEYGRAPGKFPPVDKIKAWIKIKPVIPRAYKGKVPTIDQLTFMIGRKIAKEGIKPRPLLENTKKKNISIYEKYIEDALSEDVTIHLKKLYNIK